MHIVTVACLSDNYAYLIIDDSHQAVIVDPSEATPVLRAIEQHKLKPMAILCTHHHSDHVGGIREIADRFAGLPVLGHSYDRKRLHGLTRTVEHGETLRVGELQFQALHVPGHTLGAVTWVTGDHAFTGDTLFVAGCGRVFEGDFEMMYRSLNDILGKLDPGTKIYCGHEYTATNLAFAQEVEPLNETVRQKLQQVRKARQQGRFTVPSTIGEELRTNPFLRCQANEVVDYAKAHGTVSAQPSSVFAVLRSRKDVFRA